MEGAILASNYEKRKSKEKKSLGTELIKAVDAEVADLSLRENLTEKSYHIVMNDDSRTYSLYIIGLDPVTGATQLLGKKPVTRHISLIFANNLHALRTLTGES